MYVIDPIKKTDPLLNWSLPDRVFFACGACQVLAYAVLRSYPNAGFHPYWIRPARGFRGNHIVVSNGSLAFDYHGWSKLDRLLSHVETKAERWWPGWRFDLVEIEPDVLVSEVKSAAIGCRMREPGQFLHDALPRAYAFLEKRPLPSGALSTGSPGVAVASGGDFILG